MKLSVPGEQRVDFIPENVYRWMWVPFIPMILDQDNMNRIKKLLKSRPKGLTISDIAQILKLNRNSAAKYLEILLITGQVEMKPFGNAKVYYLSQRVPISSMLKFATELIMVIDTENRITELNDNFLKFYSVDREDLLQKRISELYIPPFDALEIENLMLDVQRQEESTKEFKFVFKGQSYYFRIKIIPTVFDDGGRGFTFIIEDNTREKMIEERLRINEERIRAIVNTQTEMINRFRPDLSISFINSAGAKFMQLEEDLIPGRNLLDFVVSEDRERVLAAIQSMNKEHPVQSIENRVILPDGQVRWVEWTNHAVFDEEGEIIEYQGVGRDITQQKKAKEDLLIRDKAIADSPNGIVIGDLDGIVTYVNRAFLQIFGFDDESEVLDHPIYELSRLKEATRDRIREAIGILKERGTLVEMYRSSRASGEERDLIVSASMIRDEHGSPLCLMASVSDITENLKAEREIKILDAAIASSNNGIAVIDPREDRFLYTNKAFLAMNGVEEDTDSVGKEISSLFSHVNSFSPPFEEIKARIREEGSYAGEIRFTLPGGDVRILQFTANNVLDDEKNVVCVVVSTIDMTEQKMLEKAVRSTFEKLQESIEFFSDPTFIIDRNRKVVAWNRALEVLTGIRKEDVLGKDTFSSVFSGILEFGPVLLDLLDLPPHELATRYPDVRRFGESIYLETFVQGLNDGKGAYIWSKASRLTDREGNRIGAIESIRDMSEWKRARESMGHGENVQADSAELR